MVTLQKYLNSSAKNYIENTISTSNWLIIRTFKFIN